MSFVYWKIHGPFTEEFSKHNVSSYYSSGFYFKNKWKNLNDNPYPEVPTAIEEKAKDRRFYTTIVITKSKSKTT